MEDFTDLIIVLQLVVVGFLIFFYVTLSTSYLLDSTVNGSSKLIIQDVIKYASETHIYMET